MSLRVFFLLLLFSFTAPAEDQLAENRLMEFYRRAVPRAEQFVERIPQTDFTVYTLFDNIAILVSGNAALPKEERPSLKSVTRLLRMGEEMQDKNVESPTFGNFRWYWNHNKVTDPNAAEFALARMLSIYLDTPAPLSEEDRSILNRLLERSVSVCLNRRIRPDYTNIALYNTVHLILLGQVLDRPDVTLEGKLRLRNIVASIWDHGIFEYNSPAYYFVDVDALQLGFRHVGDLQAKQMIQALLELFWTDMSLHWYKPGLRLAGAQSRTDNFLFSTSVQMTRVFSFADLAPYDHQARYNGVLNSFRALYQPPPDIVNLNGQYSRWITRNWGQDQGQWATLYMFDDIVLGTAGAKYEGMQNMVQTVDIVESHLPTRVCEDIPEGEGTLSRPHCYFIADGRENPYGIERSPAGRGGQAKALHLDALWFGAQRTVDSLGIVLYPPKAIAEPEIINVQSHFVVRQPESIWVNEKQITLLPHQPVPIDCRAVVFRYKTCAFGLRVLGTRDQSGQPAKVFLVDDGNDQGVCRLTVEHGVPTLPPPSEELAGGAFWVRIGSHLESEEQFSAWREQFIAAKVNRLDIDCNNVAVEVTGQDGIVSIQRTDSVIMTEPAAPVGILTLNGNDLGRPILEKIPAVATFVRQRDAAKSIIIPPSGIHWEAESGYSFFEGVVEPDESASGGFAVRINHAVSWQLQTEQAGEYYLWGRVQTYDPRHDSFGVETAQRLPDGSFMRRSVNADWHLGTHENWTWVRLPFPIRLEKGIWQLTLKPREDEGRIDQLFLTSDPLVPRP